MSELEGEFRDTKESSILCKKCNGPVVYQTWDSSCGGYTDYKYTCKSCKHEYWIEGPDS